MANRNGTRQNNMEKLKIGITIGDMNGIGIEVILKALDHPAMLDLCVPVVYGSSKMVAYHKNIIKYNDFHFHSINNVERAHTAKVNVLNCWEETVNIELGSVTENGGTYAKRSLEAAVNDLKYGMIDALVTAPIHKKAMQLSHFGYPGHTEYLTKRFGGKNLMLMVNEGLRIGLVTNHLPLKEVPQQITKERVGEKIRTLHKTLQMDFGIERPLIAVLGLNPHAGDDGVLGSEEDEIIRPAIVEAKKKGILVMGPFAADGLFGSGKYRKFDGILAMYHDQGLVPFKALSFGNGVNYSAGLGYIRTSPDHGTGMDIAGKNAADPSSFRRALYTALDIVRHRRTYLEFRDNPVAKQVIPTEDANAPSEIIEDENG